MHVMVYFQFSRWFMDYFVRYCMPLLNRMYLIFMHVMVYFQFSRWFMDYFVALLHAFIEQNVSNLHACYGIFSV